MVIALLSTMPRVALAGRVEGIIYEDELEHHSWPSDWGVAKSFHLLPEGTSAIHGTVLSATPLVATVRVQEVLRGEDVPSEIRLRNHDVYFFKGTSRWDGLFREGQELVVAVVADRWAGTEPPMPVHRLPEWRDWPTPSPDQVAEYEMLGDPYLLIDQWAVLDLRSRRYHPQASPSALRDGDPPFAPEDGRCVYEREVVLRAIREQAYPHRSELMDLSARRVLRRLREFWGGVDLTRLGEDERPEDAALKEDLCGRWGYRRSCAVRPPLLSRDR